jgi:hypothetical protein
MRFFPLFRVICLAAAMFPCAGAWAQKPHLAAGVNAESASNLPTLEENASPLFVYVEMRPGSLAEDEEKALSALQAGRRIVAAITPDAEVFSKDAASMKAWEQFVQEVADFCAQHKITAFVFPSLPASAAPEEAAFFAKRTAVRLLASQSDAAVWLQLPPDAKSEWLHAMWFREGMGPYLAGLSVADAALIPAFQEALGPASAKLSFWLITGSVADPGTALTAWFDAMRQGADFVVFSSLSKDSIPVLERSMTLLEKDYRRIAPSYDRHRVTSEESGVAPLWVAFQSQRAEGGFAVVFYSKDPLEVSASASLHTASAYIKNARREDPWLEESESLRFVIPDVKNSSAEVLTSIRSHPQIIFYQPSVAPEFSAQEHSTAVVKGRYEMPVEEIIARHQIFDRRQRAQMNHYAADGRIDLHFRIAEFRSSVDISTVNRFYYAPETGMEWEQREVYLNGTRWHSNKLPEVPLVQPEKAVQVPLDLSFDKRYEYRLEGRDKVDGREAYRVSFTPLKEYQHLSLYEGKVWIDTENFAKLRVTSAQTNLEAPLVSNVETQESSWVKSEGKRYWLMTRVSGEMTFTTAGRSTVLERLMTFSNFEVNSSDFEAQRSTSYASDSQMLRDTDKGFRYLAKTPDGGREVKAQESKSALLFLGGVYYDQSVEYPIPLAGVNYFTFRLRGTPTQMNIFYAGVLGDLTISRPRLFHTPLEGTVEAFGIGVNTVDRLMSGGREDKKQRVLSRYGNAEAFLSLPFAHYYRLRAGYRLDYRSYSDDEETSSSFILPENGFTHSGVLEAKFDRKGWTFSARGQASRRSKWEFWGLPGNMEYDREQRQYRLWGASLAKTFYLPHFQKIALDADWIDGSRLDRFSQYRLTFFGTRLKGFSGSGIRFDEGVIGRLGYSFGFSEAVRFDASVEYGRTRDPLMQEWLEHWGSGIAASFVAPKNIIVNLDAGYGLSSDAHEAEGDWEVRLVLMKLFERRNHKPSAP